MSTVREQFEGQTRPLILECRPPCNDTDHRILTSCSHRYIDGHEGMAGNSYGFHYSLSEPGFEFLESLKEMGVYS